MKVAFYTLGCKVNQNETAAMQELFRLAGYTVVTKDQPCDIFIVNSCTVTSGGDTKSRRALTRAKHKNPHVITVLTGCAPQAFPDGPQCADVITGTTQRASLIQHIETYISTGRPVIAIGQHSAEFEHLPAAQGLSRTRTFIKVQDGCNRRCAYCIIPKARGPSRSRLVSDIANEVRTLTQSTPREIVFTGINLSSYGRDIGVTLADLVEEISAIPGVLRLRLSSLDPDFFTSDTISRFAKCKKLCRHFHLSLQSGCDATLRRMRRPYTTAQYKDLVTQLRAAMPNATFTTDIIVGFPSEDDAEFAQSLSFMQEMQFLKVHVFPFSVRKGTPAADFDNQIPTAIKNSRAKLMQSSADAIRTDIIATHSGTTAPALLESECEPGVYTGFTDLYIPVLTPAPKNSTGKIFTVTLSDFDGTYCAADISDH